MIYVYTVILGVFGAVFGSFAAAQVWRLRARQLRADKIAKDPDFDANEYKRLKPLLSEKVSHDRSRCLSCGHELAPHDLIPIVSWLSLRGKCRYCHQTIGWFEFLMEIGLGLFFALSLLFWPYTLASTLSYVQFGLWLIAGIILTIQVAYDAKWFLLLDMMNIALAAVGVAFAATMLASSGFSAGHIESLVASLFIMSGLYFILWIVSGGGWIGLGDVKLGIGLGLLLVTWEQAFVALFAANLIGCFVVIPAMATGKLTRKSRVPFGPFLILGTVVSVIWGGAVVSWYLSLIPALFL